MRNRSYLVKGLLILTTGILPVVGEGCLRTAQQEMEVLFAAQSSTTLLHDSWLINTFGTRILGLFNR